MSAQHTLGPPLRLKIGAAFKWHNRKFLPVLEAVNGTTIALVMNEGPGEAGPMDAERIVQCVNAHDELVAAMEAVSRFLSGAKDRLGRPDPAGDAETREAREQVRALAVKYGVPGQHTYIDQCGAVLLAAIAKATGGSHGA
jgi:hypothetical protein